MSKPPWWLTTRGMIVGTALVALFLAGNVAIERWVRETRYRREAIYWETESNRLERPTGPRAERDARLAWVRAQARRWRKAAEHPWDAVPPEPRLNLP